MRRNSYSLTLRSPKLAVLSGSLRKTVADAYSARWNGVALATPKRTVKTNSCRRRFALHKNNQSSQNQAPLNHSQSQTTAKTRQRKTFRGCLKLSNDTSLDNPLLSSFDSNSSLRLPVSSRKAKRNAKPSGEFSAVSRRTAELHSSKLALQLPTPSVLRMNPQRRRHTLTSAELAEQPCVVNTEPTPASRPLRTVARTKRARPTSVTDAFKSSLTYLC